MTWISQLDYYNDGFLNTLDDALHRVGSVATHYSVQMVTGWQRRRLEAFNEAAYCIVRRYELENPPEPRRTVPTKGGMDSRRPVESIDG